MNAATRLGVYAAGLVVVFVAALALGRVTGPVGPIGPAPTHTPASTHTPTHATEVDHGDH